MHSIALLFIGFSIIDSILLTVSASRSVAENMDRPAIISFRLLLLDLAGLQLAHYLYLNGSDDLLHSHLYLLLLYLVAPAFYFSCRHSLFPLARTRYIDLLHIIPFGAVFTMHYELAFPLAFLIGSVYLGWLLKRLYGLRAQRKQFRMESAALQILLILAGLVLVLVSVNPLVSTKFFVESYSLAIGTGFIILQYASKL